MKYYISTLFYYSNKIGSRNIFRILGRNIYKKKQYLGVVMHTCNSSTGETEAEILTVPSKLSLYIETDPDSINKTKHKLQQSAMANHI